MLTIASSSQTRPERIQPAPVNRLRFGAASTPTPVAPVASALAGNTLSKGLLTGTMSLLERHPLWKLVLTDVLAFNAPKIALARTWKERLDTATLEFSNTGITLFFSLLLPPALRALVPKISGLGKDKLTGELAANAAKLPVKLGRLATTFGFFFPFAAAFWAAPFFRNWLTMKRTKSGNFESIIGFDAPAKSNPAQQRTPQEEMSYQKRTAIKVFGTGVALGLSSLLGFGLLARQAAKFAENKGAVAGQKLIQRLQNEWKAPFTQFFERFDLKGESANQIPGGWATFIFWGLPAYVGWIHGARSDNERRERALQSVNALFWFFATPIIVKKVWDKQFWALGKNAKEFTSAIPKNLSPKKAEEALKSAVTNLSYKDIGEKLANNPTLQKAMTSLKNQQFLISDLLIPISALSAVQFINFRLTERKIKASQAKQLSAPPNTFVPGFPTTPLYRPTSPFQVFVNERQNLTNR